MPALALTYAIAAPIMPAPNTTTFLTDVGSSDSGRPREPCTACRSKKNAWIMFLATWPVTRSTK